MINFVKSSIDYVVDNKREFVVDDVHFSRNRDWPFPVFMNFMVFRKKTTIRHSIHSMYKVMSQFNFEKISDSAFSQQRRYIDPEVFNVMSKEFLKNIGITDDKKILKTFKGYRVFGGDGSDIEILNLISTRSEFNVKPNKSNYTYPAIAKFSAIVDVLNGYILDGRLGDFKQGDFPMAHENLKYIDDVVDFNNSIFTYDRGYVGLELNARLIELGSKFVIRLRDGVYIDEINNMKSNDEMVKLELTDDRLEKFKDPELKAKYENQEHIELRIVKTKIKVIRFDENGNEYEDEVDEILMTNLEKEEMTIEDLKEIYKLRWGIEVDFNTLKHRFKIENFTGTIKLTHQQDLYSQFIIFNLFCYINNLLNFKIQKRFIKKFGMEYLDYDFEYKINQANLIRNLLEDIAVIMLVPLKTRKSFLLSNLFTESLKNPIKTYKNRHNKRDGKKNSQKHRQNCKPMK